MKAVLPAVRVGNVKVFFSRLGYHLERNGSFAKRAGPGTFPRYHVYAEVQGDQIRVSVHLDAKAPTYEGTSAHAGEYDGPLIEAEMSRIMRAVS
ncbi:MAG: hypothetical protein AAB424_03895 [Patescibacteria group bacterium]